MKRNRFQAYGAAVLLPFPALSLVLPHPDLMEDVRSVFFSDHNFLLLLFLCLQLGWVVASHGLPQPNQILVKFVRWWLAVADGPTKQLPNSYLFRH